MLLVLVIVKSRVGVRVNLGKRSSGDSEPISCVANFYMKDEHRLKSMKGL